MFTSLCQAELPGKTRVGFEPTTNGLRGNQRGVCCKAPYSMR